jgi:hypothetical protein
VSEGLRILAGGAPDAARWAALASAAAAIADEWATPPADPTPPAYRSRWRRAGLLELSEVPIHVKDDGPPWRSA